MAAVFLDRDETEVEANAFAATATAIQSQRRDFARGPLPAVATPEFVGRFHRDRQRATALTRLPGAGEPAGPNVAKALLPLVYQELRRLAAQKMASQAAGHTLQPTALVHEAWLRLVSNEEARFAGRTHFFATAAEAMRQILIDHARRKAAARHGGGQVRVDAEEFEIATQVPDEEMLAVDEVLDKLAAEEPQKAELVKLRYFAGMTFEEAAAVLAVSVPTAKRYWNYARAWLHEEIQAGKAK